MNNTREGSQWEYGLDGSSDDDDNNNNDDVGAQEQMGKLESKYALRLGEA